MFFNCRRSLTCISFDIITRVRDVNVTDSLTCPGTPLIRIIREPSRRSRSKSSSKKEHSRRPSRSPHPSPLVVALQLVEEERQANQLKSLLRGTSDRDRIEQEVRRADDACGRAQFAERREKEALGRATAAEKARQELEDENVQLLQESRRFQMQLEAAGRDLRRLQSDMDMLRQEYEDMEKSDARARESSRRYQMALRDLEARQESREEGKRLAIKKSFNDGQTAGWDEGYSVGYKEGKRVGVEEGLKTGRKEGLREGREQGQNEERRNALESFDKFLAEGDESVS